MILIPSCTCLLSGLHSLLGIHSAVIIIIIIIVIIIIVNPIPAGHNLIACCLLGPSQGALWHWQLICKLCSLISIHIAAIIMVNSITAGHDLIACCLPGRSQGALRHWQLVFRLHCTDFCTCRLRSSPSIMMEPLHCTPEA